ncbi:hypothetical protein ACP70R_012819 [Stipagrostis hirtigluma subsp. patula]
MPGGAIFMDNLIFISQPKTYAIFMDNLINSAEDARYLRDGGIIEHWLGSDGEVAELFSRLCQEVVFVVNDSYLSAVEHVDRQSQLNHNYFFSNPWTIVSVVAGAFLLLLTMIQATYGAYGYYRPMH